MGSIKKTETGSVLNFNTYLPKTLDETKISFTPKQEGGGTPSPENVREIVGKNGITVWQSNDDRSRPLPKEYQQIEYLESTGTQWIDTGYVPVEDTWVDMEYGFSGTYSGEQVMLGASSSNYTANNTTGLTVEFYNYNKWYCGCGGSIFGNVLTGYGKDLYIKHRVILSKDSLTVDDNIQSSHGSATFDPSQPCYLYAINAYGIGARRLSTTLRLYSVKLYENENIMRNFIPCYRKSDNKPGMYDLVSGTFYTNSGTGEFRVGEDIVGVETSVSFPAVGKNLCPDISTWESGYTNNTGGISPANGLRSEKYSDYIPVDELENYTFSYNADGIRDQLWTCICAYDENKKYLIRHISNSNFVSRKLIAGTRFVRLSCRTYSMTTEAQFEKSAEPTAYEPFDNTIYGGYVDLVAGEVVVEWMKVDMGEQNWAFTWNTFNTAPSNFTGNGANGTPTEVICDIYPSDINAPATEVGRIDKNIRGRANYKHICIRDDDYTSTADFKTAVTGHYLAYKLAEPIHYPLSPHILTTLKGNNVMWSDGDSLTISYTDDVVNTYDFRRHISLDTPHKASASGAVASFGTDMVGKMKCKIHFLPKQEGSGTPSPDNVRNISGRSGVKLWHGGKYQLLDYVYCDGSQPYIQVNETLPLGYKVKARIKRTSGTTESAFFGSSNSELYYGSSTTEVYAWGKLRRDSKTIGDVDEIIATVYPAVIPNYAIGIRNGFKGSATFTGNIHSVSIYDTDGTPVRNFVPVVENSTQTIGFLDTVNDEFFPPFDEDKFIAGTVSADDTTNEITFTFPSTVGDNGVVYGGYLDTEKGELVAEWYSVPTSAWTTYRQNNGYICYRAETSHGTILGGTWLSNVISEYGSFSSSAMNKNIIQKNNSGGGAIYMALDENVDISTVQVVYQTSTPIHYSLTPQSIATLRGSNRIWSDGGSVEVEYYKHTDEPQEYIPAEVLGTGNIAIVTSDGYLIGEEQDYIKY